MYGYEPPKEPRQGSWGEVASFSWVALQIVVPWLLAVVLGMGMLGVALYFVTFNAWLALIPIGILVLGVVFLIFRERRQKRELEDRLGITDEDRL